MSEIILSILICTLPEPERINKFQRLINILTPQIKDLPVEIIQDDTPRGLLSIGAKSNNLKKRAQGKYICRIDDDDIPSFHYIQLLLEGCKSDKDIITFDMDYYRDGLYEKTYIINRFLQDGNDWCSKFWAQNYNPSHIFTVQGIYYHLCPVKKTIADKLEFIDSNEMEDVNYSEGVKNIVNSEYRVPHVLLSVFYDSNKKSNV